MICAWKGSNEFVINCYSIAQSIDAFILPHHNSVNRVFLFTIVCFFHRKCNMQRCVVGEVENIFNSRKITQRNIPYDFNLYLEKHCVRQP